MEKDNKKEELAILVLKVELLRAILEIAKILLEK